jgi:hypothetical protein
VTRSRPWSAGPGRGGDGVRRAGTTLAGLALLVAGLAGTAPAAGAGDVIARLGTITVSATALRPGPSGTLVAGLQVATSGQPSDQLDAAIAAGGAPVAVYHQQVDVEVISDLTDCGGLVPPAGTVAQWLHYGPLLVPGHARGVSLAADATLSVQPAASPPAGATLAITLYFAQAGPLTLRLPVDHP